MAETPRLAGAVETIALDRQGELAIESAPSIIEEWFLEGYGKVVCEPGGVLNLNRYLPDTLRETRLMRHLVVEREARVEISFGFSDELTLALDDQVIYQGKHLFQVSSDWHQQGYVSLDHTLACTLAPGAHRLTATVSRTEAFGWGLTMALTGAGVRLEPAWRGSLVAP